MSGKKSSKPESKENGEPENVDVGQWSDEPKPVRRTFPGPRQVDAALRVAMERKAFADVVGHAKEALDSEICGVLAGQVCEDDEGLFVHVQASIRGASAREANARVTFTQETWNAVHETLERDYPKLHIVGWYHSHPGFGVEFSEMDVFIQRNFFPSDTQIALVTDPLGGDTAICRSAGEGISYLDRFWVDGREHALRVPVQEQGRESHAPASVSSLSDDRLESLEKRLSQLIQSVDEQRASFYRFLITLLVIALMGTAGWIGYTIYASYTNRMEPPQLRGYIPVPIRVGDKTVMIGVGVAQWDVPPELNAALIELEKRKQAGGKDAAPSSPAPDGSSVILVTPPSPDAAPGQATPAPDTSAKPAAPENSPPPSTPPPSTPAPAKAP